MDSIHKNQSEDKHIPLTGPEAIKKIKELAEKNNSCFFCTMTDTGQSSRPMSVQQVDDSGDLWFLSAKDSHKNREIATNHAVHLYFQGSPHSDFLHLYGSAMILDDPAKIKELWSPVLKTWFTEGENDPRISLIKIRPLQGHYWDTKHSHALAGVKIILGAMLGKTLDDSVEGILRV